LVLACVVLVLFIGAIFLMERELRRVGLFGEDPAPSSGSPASSPPAGKGAPRQRPSSPSAAEELTPDEKQQLDRILRSR
jgi:hypothetical protein